MNDPAYGETQKHSGADPPPEAIRPTHRTGDPSHRARTAKVGYGAARRRSSGRRGTLRDSLD
jgi:hypothetical protein